MFSGNSAHQRTFSRVAVTARAEHDHELAPGIRPERLQRLRKRVGFMRVIDEDRSAVSLGHPFEAALGAFEMLKLGENRIRIAAGADRESRRDQRVFNLEFAYQR